MPPERDRLEEIYRLERENNKLLRGMKRRAWWGTIVRILMLMLALGVPLWLYFTYLAPVLEQMSDTMEAITGQRVELQETFSSWADAFSRFTDSFKSATST
jgi:hypothetical protein